jgi:hypothetical protein
MSFKVDPIGQQTFKSGSVNAVKGLPPEVVITSDGKTVNIQKNFQLSLNELTVVALLDQIIQQRLTSTSFLLTFDTREIELLLSQVNLPAEIKVDDVIGGLWIKTQELVLAELAIEGDQKVFEAEKNWLILASARTWESIVNIFKFRYLEVNTFNKFGKEGEEPPFRVVFTNRQAQALQFCASRIANIVKGTKG